MKLVITSLSIATIVASFLLNNITKIIKLPQEVNEEVQVLSAQTSPTPEATPEEQPEFTSENSFYYQGSKIIEQSEDKIVMEVKADPEVVTDWYKNLLHSLDLPINSTIITTTNGQVNNKLISSSTGKRVEVQITKYPDSSIVFIHVNY